MMWRRKLFHTGYFLNSLHLIRSVRPSRVPTVIQELTSSQKTFLNALKYQNPNVWFAMFDLVSLV